MLYPVQPVPTHHAEMTLSMLRRHQPLVHCLTNDVVMPFTANVLLALRASPAMIIDPQEAAEFAPQASALLVNVGTLTQWQCEAMQAAITAANEAHVPWTLDPVAVGCTRLRTDFCFSLLAQKPAAIRGNASEILLLAGGEQPGRGVDSAHASQEALEAARQLASQSKSMVIVTGEKDYVTDGERVFQLTGGSSLMTRVVGTGCALSAVIAAVTSLSGDRLMHLAAACYWFKQAGQQASVQANGPGSLASLFLDALWNLGKEDNECTLSRH